MVPKNRVTTHPGEILKEGFLVPLNISQRQLAQDINVSEQYISDIIKGRRGISKKMANKLAERFGTSARFWAQLQLNHDFSKGMFG